jgi:CDP-glucose 4,6-dehydratase
MVRDRTGYEAEVPKDAVLAFGDVRDADFCRRVIADYEVNTIFHLAAQAIVSACAEDPVTALDVAVLGTSRVLQAAKDSGRPIKVIVSTSDKVYGAAPSPYLESTALDARHAYEVSKACQDLVARMYYNNFKLDVRVARAVNIYGPGDPNNTRVIPQTIQRLLRGEPPLVHAGAWSMRRQYIYIDDLIDALHSIEAHGSPGEAYCVGSPDPALSVGEVIGRIAKQMGSELAPEVKERDARFLEIQEQSAIDDKLRALDWVPQVDFDEGIRQTIAWYRGQC